MIYAAFSPITAYIREFDPYIRVHRDVCISPNPFLFFLDMDPTHLIPGLPYALRSVGFDPSLSLVKLYKEPLGTLKGEGDKRELRVSKLSSIVARTILESTSLCPFGALLRSSQAFY